jgi:hypothetical protein
MKMKINSLDSNADAAARSGYPTQVIEPATKLGNEVCGLIERANESVSEKGVSVLPTNLCAIESRSHAKGRPR